LKTNIKKIIYKLFNNLELSNYIYNWIDICSIDDEPNKLLTLLYLALVIVAICKIALNFRAYLMREREKEADLIEFDDDN
jgi:hypothetical protein